MAHFHLDYANAEFTDALLVEDVGDRKLAMTLIKEMIGSGLNVQCEKFEDYVLEMTARIGRAGIVDPDHGFHNMLATEANEAIRIDFEVARNVLAPRWAPRLYSQMLGRLLTTYTYSVQPDSERAFRFAVRMAETMRPSRWVLKQVRAYLLTALARQRQEIGLDMRVNLQW